MVDLEALLHLQFKFFTFILIGYILRKINVISSSNRKSIADLVIYVVLPANIITSFLIEMNASIFHSSLIILLVSIGIQIFCVVFSKHLYRKEEERQQKVLTYATICSNAGFLGNPLIEGIYGLEGLLYASVYLIPQRIVMWSSGLSLFVETSKKEIFKKVISHPCIIAVVVGAFLMVTQLHLPLIVKDVLSSIGSCNTFLSMLVIGGILAEIDIKSVVSKLTVYFTFLRLILLPLGVFAFCYVLRFPYLVCAIASVLAGMPAGTTTAILAEKYEGDAKLAVKIIFLSTLLSMFTIPFLCLFIDTMF